MSLFESKLPSAPRVTHYGHMKKVTSMGWSGLGSLCTGSSDTNLRVWTLELTGTLRKCEVLKGHTGAVDALSWCPDSPFTLTSGATDRSVKLWDTRAGGRCTGSVATKGQALNLGWTPEANAVIMGTRDDTLVVIDVRKMGGGGGGVGGSAVLSTTSFREEVNEFAFAPRQGLLYVGLGLIGVTDEGSVAVLSLSGGGGSSSGVGGAEGSSGGGGASTSPPSVLTEITRIPCHTAPITHLRFNPEGNRFATGSGDSAVCLWDAEEGCVVSVFDRAESQLRGLSWARDGRHLAIACGDKEESAKTLDIIRVQDGTRAFSLPCPAAINHVCWAPHATILAYSVEDIGSATASGKPGGDRFEAGAIKVLAVPP